jgi:hypothetical protein
VLYIETESMRDDKETRKRREYVAGLYEGPKWKTRVAKMPAHQITAIYLRAQEDEKALNQKSPKTNGEPKTIVDQVPEQLNLLGESEMEAGSSESERIERPVPCPECESTKGYSRVGKFRVQCLSCNALLKNAEVNFEDQEPQ